MTRDMKPIGTKNVAVIEPNSSVYNPVYHSRFEYRGNIDATATLYCQLNTLTREGTTVVQMIFCLLLKLYRQWGFQC